MKPLEKKKQRSSSDRRSRHARARRRNDVQSSDICGKRNSKAGSSFKERMEQIPSLNLKGLPSIIQEAADEQHLDLQEEVIKLCLIRILFVIKPGSRQKPRYLQIRTLRRLIYGHGDTLLMARTGYGKSIIFHAYSILTGKITLQIIPLDKLGDEQQHDIQKLHGSNPCLLNAKSKEPDLLPRIITGEFTHVLLGPEQASTEGFREALKDPRLQARIGLVAIDECHLVKQWGEGFRETYSILHELRSILREEVVWFGCTATLDQATEDAILRNGGFRPLGDRPYETEVLRTSINRTDLSLCVCPIPRKQLGKWDPLFFLLDNATGPLGAATPEQIPKTIVFVDSIEKDEGLANWIRDHLINKTSLSSKSSKSSLPSEPGSVDNNNSDDDIEPSPSTESPESSAVPPKPRYSQDNENPSLNVYNIITTYNSDVCEYDQSVRYAEFLKPSSSIRIIIATTSLGMGVNVPDVERVVVWKFPRGRQPADVWQRVGRGGRGEGRTSIAYVFLPYWAFDIEGCYRPGTAEQNDTEPASQGRQKKSKRRQRNTITKLHYQPQQPRPRGTTPAQDLDLSEVESIASQLEDEDGICDGDGTCSQEPVISPKGTPYWTKQEIRYRQVLEAVWKAICNGPCKRSPILRHLGELQVRDGTQNVRMEPGLCCNGCNPNLNPPLSIPPILRLRPKPAGKGSRAYLALEVFDKWACEQANSMFSNPHRRYNMPPDLFMPRHCRWQLASLFSSGRVEKEFWDTLSIETLSHKKKAPLLREWEYRDIAGEKLIKRLQALAKEVNEKFEAQKVANADAKARKQQALDELASQTSSQESSPNSTNSETYERESRAKDDRLVRQAMANARLRAQAQNPHGQSNLNTILRLTTPHPLASSITLPSIGSTTPPPFIGSTTPHTPKADSSSRGFTADLVSYPTGFSPQVTAVLTQLRQGLPIDNWIKERRTHICASDSQERVPETKTLTQGRDSQDIVLETQLETGLDSQERVPETQLSIVPSTEPQLRIPKTQTPEIVPKDLVLRRRPLRGQKRSLALPNTTPSKTRAAKRRVALRDKDTNTRQPATIKSICNTPNIRRSSRIGKENLYKNK
jgi:Helicase conserved C-terminal domain/DEAD/DEAH box helicase